MTYGRARTRSRSFARPSSSTRAWARSSVGLFAAAAATAACGSGSATPGAPDTTGSEQAGVTWNGQIAPIVQQKCVGCHRTGGIAPMSLESYAVAKRYAALMLSQVKDGIMPPWGAKTTDECAPPFAFKDDPRLTPDEVSRLEDWVNAGAPEGAPSTKPLPKPVTTELTGADLHLTMAAPTTVTGYDDRFVCYSLDPGLDQQKWVNAVQVEPGNSAIVHHVLLFTDPEGASAALADADGKYDCFGGPNLPADSPISLMGAWAPGAVPAVMPDGVALELPAHARLVMQVHYHPAGQTETDPGTSVDIRYADKAPSHIGLLALVGNFDRADDAQAGGKGFGLMPSDDDPPSGPDFVIPANAPAHVETQRALVQAVNAAGIQGVVSGYRIWGVGAHMHYVGHDMKIELQHADGTTDCLLETPAWDFTWQRLYYYDASLTDVPYAKIGDVLRMRCTYDNTMNNAYVRTALSQQGLSAPVDVRLGETTLDEMCLGVFGVALESNGLAGLGGTSP